MIIRFLRNMGYLYLDGLKSIPNSFVLFMYSWAHPSSQRHHACVSMPDSELGPWETVEPGCGIPSLTV